VAAFKGCTQGCQPLLIYEEGAIITGTKHGVVTTQLAVKQHKISTADKAPRTGSSQDTLKTVQGYVKEWLEFRKNLLKTWERDTKLYNNERVERHYEGVADTFVPMTYSTCEAMSSALVTADFSTKFVPQDIYAYLKDRLMPGFTGTTTDELGNETPETEQDYLIRAIQNAVQGGAITDESLEVLNALYDYCWDKGSWSEEIGFGVDDGLKIGNGGWWMILQNGLPKLINVPFPDFVFDPRASEDGTGRFGGRRYLTSLKALKAEVITDPTTQKTTKRYSNLNNIKKRDANSKDDKTDKELMEDLLLGSTVAKSNKNGQLTDDDQVEVIELMTDERIYTLVNREVLAEDAENPIVAQAKVRGITDLTQLIKIPGIVWTNNKKKSMLIGRSEISTFWKEQERLNDATNQKSDAVTRALLQNYRADPALKPQAKSFSVPGAVIWGTAGQYEAVAPAQVPAVAFTEENSIKNNIRETTATDQIVKGVGSTSDVTATEAKLQVAQSGQRIEKKVGQLEKGPLKRIARLALQYIRLFIADPFIVPQESNNGITPLLYSPDKYNYDFEPKVTLTISAQNKRRQEQTEAVETYKILIEDPTNNLKEVKRVMLPKIIDLDKDEIERIIENPNAGMPGMPPDGMAPDAGAMPSSAPMPMPAPQTAGAIA
jgi:hypothetical protein